MLFYWLQTCAAVCSFAVALTRSDADVTISLKIAIFKQKNSTVVQGNKETVDGLTLQLCIV